MLKALERRRARGIPDHANELTDEERRQEAWRILFCVIFDIIGVSELKYSWMQLVSSINVVFFKTDEIYDHQGKV